MTVGHIYSIQNPEGREIYVGSTTKTDTLRWGQWKAAAKTGDWLACPMLRYAKERWGDLDACSYHVLTTVELPGDVAVAKQILRRLEAAFIESALAREEPLHNEYYDAHCRSMGIKTPQRRVKLEPRVVIRKLH